MAKKDLTRRDVLRTTAAAAMGAGLAPGVFAESFGQGGGSTSANEKVVVGLIGCGGMGMSNVRSLWGFNDFEVAAICDVDTRRIPGDYKAIDDKYGRKPEVFKDYRQMLERKDIDAVIIGTPDHWHALNLVHACEAGKDIYCEKPISHNITESRAMVAAQKRFGRVVQVGTWQRSNREFTDAIDYVRSGKLGKVVHCRAWIADGTRLGKQQPKEAPAEFDYDMWIGPAKMVPYQDNITHWNWRWMLNTGGGLTTDWGVHMMDIALLGMSKGQDLVMPTRVAATGGVWALTDDDRDAPDTMEALLTFEDPDFCMTWSVLRDHPGKPGHGTEFVSADGRTVRVWRGGWVILGPDGKEIDKVQAEPVPTNHWRNWLDCIKTREKPRADLASVAQTTDCCHLVNAALFSGEQVRWDKSKYDIAGSAGKRTMGYTRQYRKGYTLKQY